MNFMSIFVGTISFLEVISTPYITLPKRTLLIGETLYIPCEVNTVKAGTSYKWFKDNIIISTSKVLDINSLRSSDTGMYGCSVTVRWKAGSVTKKSAHVKVTGINSIF